MPELFAPCPPVPAKPGRARFVLLKQKANTVLLTADGTLPELDTEPAGAEAFRIGQFGETPCHAAVLPEAKDSPPSSYCTLW